VEVRLTHPRGNRFLFFGIALLFLVPSLCRAQEFNYWSQQVGAYSSLLSGSVTASVRDNSAIYYNPGALGFIENSSLSVVGNLAYLRGHNIRNGAGQDLPLMNNNVDAVSQIFSAIHKLTDEISITYGLMNRNFHSMRFQVRHDGFYEIMEDLPGEEYYRGGFDYSKKLREDWLGLGIGWKIIPELGFGITLFGTVLSDNYSSNLTSNVFKYDEPTGIYSRVGYNNQYEVLRYSSVGGLLVAGFAYDNGSFQIGLNITSPVLHLQIFSGGMLDRTQSLDIPTIYDVPVYASITADQAETRQNTPLIIDLGFSRILGTRTSSNFKLSYFSQVNPYQMIDAGPPEDDVTGFYPQDPRFYNMTIAHKHTFNFAIGIERRVSEDVSILGGFNTDFNYFAHDKTDDYFKYHNSLSYLNLYQANGGINWFREKFNVILGLSFAYGYKFGVEQQVNLKDPKDYLGLYGPVQVNTDSYYLRANFVFGFTYLFPRF